MSRPSYEDLLAASRRHEVDAVRDLGLRLMAGDGAPLDPESGAKLVQAAAEKGDAEALRRTALFAASGVFRPLDMGAAFDLLQRAAERGSAAARGELAALADAPPPPAYASPELWKRLRARLDPAEWTAPAAKIVVSDAPRIRRVERFASPAVCRWLIERARPRLGPARVYAERADGAVESARSNSETPFTFMDSDVVLTAVQAKIAATVGLPPPQMEQASVLHYAVGQEFRPHFDFLAPGDPTTQASLDQLGQRVATFLLYLNDGYEGGETDFPTAGLKVAGRTGEAVYFANVGLDGLPDRRTLHAGRAPTAGEKWVLSQFIRGPRVAGAAR